MSGWPVIVTVTAGHIFNFAFYVQLPIESSAVHKTELFNQHARLHTDGKNV